MKYYPLKSIKTDLKALLAALPIAEDNPELQFKAVRTSTATSRENILALMPELTALPAAVVCISGGDYKSSGMERSISPAIVIIDSFVADLDDQADSIHDIIDNLAAAFMGNTPGQPKIINTVRYSLGEFTNIELDSFSCAYVLELEAISPMLSA
ncbi:MAG: hypothetical protein L3J71_03520 [Victivallaceae bacterium]|nr:hypothetical protein [Victivallaceae bacterium]